MMPIVEQVKELLAGNVKVYQYDIDENQQLAESQNVESIPTFIIYENGNEMWRQSGEMDGNVLLNKIQAYM